LVIVEGHTIPYAYRLLKPAVNRWSWFVIVSPSTYFCFSTMLASILLPIQGMIYTAIFLTASKDDIPKRRLCAVLTVVAIFVLPAVTDVLLWGSFPLPVANDGVHIRMIPFIPWPSGPFGQY
jgi:hypothetical protein